MFPGTKELCEVSIGRCIECTADSECDSDATSPICELSTNDKACRGCASNAECLAKDALLLYCNVGTGECLECLADGDCVDPNLP